MDENSTNENSCENTNESTGVATNETSNKPGGKFLEWLAQYSDEEKYPKQPTPWFVYVLSVPVGFCVIWLVRRGMISLAESFGTTDNIDTPLSWVICFILFLLASLIFVLLYQCVARYGLSVKCKRKVDSRVQNFCHLVSTFGLHLRG